MSTPLLPSEAPPEPRAIVDVRLIPTRDGRGWRVTVNGRAIRVPMALESPSHALHTIARLIDGVAWTAGASESSIIADPDSRLFE